MECSVLLCVAVCAHQSSPWQFFTHANLATNDPWVFLREDVTNDAMLPSSAFSEPANA